MKRTYSQIDMDERRRIARWRMAGISIEIIAEKLGRHRSTIFREIKRNTFVDPQMPDLNGYYCVTANDMARERRAKLRKLARFAHVRQSVTPAYPCPVCFPFTMKEGQLSKIYQDWEMVRYNEDLGTMHNGVQLQFATMLARKPA